MTASPSGADVHLPLAAVLDRALPLLSVTDRPSERTTWVREVIARAGEDPLAPWRAEVHRQHEAQAGGPVGNHVAAAFVLQYWCDVAAVPIAYAAQLTGRIIAEPSAGLGFELAATGYPNRLVLPTEVTMQSAPESELWKLAQAAYVEVVSEVVTHYAPDIKMSSQQRWGVVEDMWQSARRGAAGAAGEITGAVPKRRSCCFIFLLPGANECSACPRHGY